MKAEAPRAVGLEQCLGALKQQELPFLLSSGRSLDILSAPLT